MVGMKELVIGLIRRTQDPTASIKINELYNSTGLVARMLTCLTSPEEAKALKERLLKDFPDEELNKLCAEPAFIIALLSMLAEALIAFTNASAQRI